MAISPADRDRLLAAIAAQPDPSLEDVVSLSQAGLRIGIGVILDGHILTGVITSEREHADYLDSTLAKVFAEFRDDSDTTEMRKWFDSMGEIFEGEGFFQKKAAQRREQASDALQHMKAEPDDQSIFELDEEVVREFLALRKPRAFALEASVLWLPAQNTSVEYGTVRVQLSHVGAWWLLEGPQAESAEEEATEVAD